jgi:hypothetical protein
VLVFESKKMFCGQNLNLSVLAIQFIDWIPSSKSSLAFLFGNFSVKWLNKTPTFRFMS